MIDTRLGRRRNRRPLHGRVGTLIVKTSDATVDVTLRGQLAYLQTTSLAPITVAAGDSGRLAQIGAREGVDTVALPLERDPSPFRDVLALVALIRLMRRDRPAVVIYGTPKATLLAGIAALVARVPTRIQILHGLRLETTSGLARTLLLTTERLAVRLATHTVAVGFGLRNRCRELGIDTRRMHVIGRGSVVGTDTVRASAIASDPAARERSRRVLGVRDDEVVVGFVGRVTRDKGIEVLVRAVQNARAQGLRIRLAVIGLDEGISDLDADVQAALASSWVSMTGNVADPIELYSAFDVFCLPSFREGLSSVAMEAWAARVPVVVSDCTGLGDLVAGGQTGIVVPVEDVEATTTALVHVLRDADLADRLRRNGAEHVESHFAREALWARCARFYEAARDEPGARWRSEREPTGA